MRVTCLLGGNHAESCVLACRNRDAESCLWGPLKKGGRKKSDARSTAVVRDESVWGELLISGLPVDTGGGPARFYAKIRKSRIEGKRGGAKGGCHILRMRQPWAWGLLYQSGVFGAEKRSAPF